MAGSSLRLVVVLLCALTAAQAMAAGPATAAEIGDSKAPAESTQTLESYRADVARMQALVAACEARNAACDTHQVARDAQVGDVAHGGFAMHWGWLRDALTDANHAKPDARAKLLQACAQRLQAMAQESGAAPNAQADAQARAAADAVLRRPEFQTKAGPTWWERKKAQWLGWLMRLFDGLSEFGANRPLLAPILEWMLFGGAAVGLVVFLIRATARQRRRVALSAGAVQAAAWDREATDWAQMAAAHAGREEWREAVHCLYWSAIVLLESRRAWRHNPSRTPREYVRLLRPGSAQQQGLRGLTQIFERVWYGFGEADRARYQQALAEYERLAAGDGGTAAAAASGLSAEAA
jgi:hypothetical protein